MKIKEIWRYPVKSMQGESIGTSSMTSNGLEGDRAWALWDGVTIRGAKKFAQLMQAKAWFEEPGKAPLVQLPDQAPFSAEDTECNAHLSDFCGADVTLEPLRSPDDLDYYRRVAEERSEAEARAFFGLGPDDPFPDFSRFPSSVAEYASPPGTYFDCFSLHIMTTSSLKSLQALAPDSQIDARRFRPNLIIETDEEGFPETGWEGKKLKVGDVVINLTLMCPRCVMPTIGFDEFKKDPGIMRTLVQNCQHSLGIYAEVEQPGTLQVGAEVQLI